MYFGLTEDQRALQETARRYAREKLLPHYQTREAEGRFDRAMVAEMGALGLIAPDLPEQFGGLGVDGLTAGVLIEEIGYGDLSVSYVQLLTMLCAGVVARHAKPDVAAEVLPLFDDGTLRPVVDSRHPFDAIADAHRAMEANANIGKILVDLV